MPRLNPRTIEETPDKKHGYYACRKCSSKHFMIYPSGGPAEHPTRLVCSHCRRWYYV